MMIKTFICVLICEWYESCEQEESEQKRYEIEWLRDVILESLAGKRNAQRI